MNAKRLEGQIAWISGGASGMGEATAQLFAEEGAKVAIVDIQAELGQKVVDGIIANGGEAIFHECDVAREDEVRQSIEKTVAHFGGLQIIVNCAGVVHVVSLHEYSEEEWDQLMGVNVKSIFFSIKHGHPHLCKNQRSYMVNIGFSGQLHRTSPNAGLHHFQARCTRIESDLSHLTTPPMGCVATVSVPESPTRQCCATT